ncbi:MAG: hypothetical protein ISR65_04815 [Bacteriovoracaceae bacterium]|nr:hypothetical protein [Bacteriovoracaceae bacterium]
MLLFVHSGCSHKETYESSLRSFKRIDFGHVYQGIGITRYFLPDLPTWVNFSQVGRCKREKSIRYMHLQRLRSSFALTYQEAIQFQLFFNREYNLLKSQNRAGYLKIEREEQLFHDILDKINSKIYAFNPPSFKRVNVVWIDPLLGLKNGTQVLEKLMKGKQMAQGHPVFVSTCKTIDEMDSFLKMHKLNEQNIRVMSAEMFSTYNKENIAENFFSIDFTELFAKKEQKIHLFVLKRKRPLQIPDEFNGEFVVHHFN